MGTVSISFWNTHLKCDPVLKLQKGLNIVNPRLDERSKEDLKLNKANFYLSKNGYTKHTYGYIGKQRDKYILLSSKPKHFFNPLSDYLLTFHQSQWPCLKETVEDLVNVFGIEDAEAILFKGKISRLDAWLDTDIHFLRCRKSIYRPNIRTKTRITFDKRSLYLGEKKPRQALFYEKEPFKINYVDIPLSKKPEYCTRIEIRHFGNKIPITSYADYAKLADVPLFKLLWNRFYSDAVLLKNLQASRISEEKVNKFFEDLNTEGLGYARKRYNKKRNFSRTFEEIFKQSGRSINFSSLWSKKVKNQIVGDFDIKKYFIHLREWDEENNTIEKLYNKRHTNVCLELNS